MAPLWRHGRVSPARRNPGKRSFKGAPPPRSPRMKELPPELRPRERLLAGGAAALSVAELIAVLLRVGAPGRSALDVAVDLLRTQGSLDRLAGASPAELCRTRGVGEVKALHLLAAFELGRRLGALPPRVRPVVHSPADAAALVMSELRFAETERFVVLLLNTRNEMLGRVEISRGG